MRVHRLALLGDRRLKVQAAVAASLVYWTSKPALAEVTACARFSKRWPARRYTSINNPLLYIIGIVFVTVCWWVGVLCVCVSMHVFFMYDC